VAYEPAYERFEVLGPDGQARKAQFTKAGFLAAGDQPELYFFELGGAKVIVAISGDALREFQRRRRYLTREEKIDLAGLLLKQRIEAGVPLVPENLHIRSGELEELVRQLGFRV
jgi:hypothetical protein